MVGRAEGRWRGSTFWQCSERRSRWARRHSRRRLPPSARPLADDPNDANLTYWYWGEDDAPGANDWLKKQVAAYEKAHPKVKIKIVAAVLRHADLGVHDRGADQERAGHRHAVGDAADADTGLERLVRADLRLRARQ